MTTDALHNYKVNIFKFEFEFCSGQFFNLFTCLNALYSTRQPMTSKLYAFFHRPTLQHGPPVFHRACSLWECVGALHVDRLASILSYCRDSISGKFHSRLNFSAEHVGLYEEIAMTPQLLSHKPADDYICSNYRSCLESGPFISSKVEGFSFLRDMHSICKTSNAN